MTLNAVYGLTQALHWNTKWDYFINLSASDLPLLRAVREPPPPDHTTTDEHGMLPHLHYPWIAIYNSDRGQVGGEEFHGVIFPISVAVVVLAYRAVTAHSPQVR